MKVITPCFLGGAKGGSIKDEEEWEKFCRENYRRDYEDYEAIKQEREKLEQNNRQNTREIKRIEREMKQPGIQTPQYKKLEQDKKKLEENTRQKRRDIQNRKRDIEQLQRETRDEDDLLDEIRPASFIGDWRYWLRTFLLDDAIAQEHEAILFGDIRKSLFGDIRKSQGRKTGQGRLHVRPGNSWPQEDDIVHSAGRLVDMGAGDDLKPLIYLGYGPIHNSGVLERPAWKPETSLELEVKIAADTLSSKPKTPEELWGNLRKALWLWQTFGGLGARSRRGWGSIQVAVDQELSDIPSPECEKWHDWFGNIPNTPEEFAQGVAQKLNEILQGKYPLQTSRNAYVLCTSDANPLDADLSVCKSTAGQPHFSNFQSFCAVIPKKSFPGWGEALAWMGNKMLQVRSNDDGDYSNATLCRVQDHNAVYDKLASSKVLQQAPYRAAFGLPHNYFFPDRDRMGRARGKKGEAGFEAMQKTTKGRRASPVLLHVVEPGNGQYLPVALWFKADLVSNKASIAMKGEWVKNPRDQQNIPLPDWSGVVEFLKSLV